MAFVIALVGVILRVAYHAIRTCVLGDGRAEFRKSSMAESLCRGTDLWLMGCGAMLALQDVHMEFALAFLIAIAAALGLVACLVLQLLRHEIYAEAPLREDLSQDQRRRWARSAGGEYAVGAVMYASHWLIWSTHVS